MKINKGWFAILILSNSFCHGQTSDSTKTIRHFSGTASVTNNGISLVPSFSLGKPAVIAVMSFGGERFSIDPDIRFGLDGKPWTFLFWARYKLFAKGKFRMNTGVHLGLNFRTSDMIINGSPIETTVVRRYLSAELSPNYFVAKNISIGAYYLYSRGIDNGTVGNTHFITLNSNFTHIALTKQIYLRVNPQVFYLNQDDQTGQFFTNVLTLAKNNFPLAVSYLINKKLSGEIPGKDFISSLSLLYSFSRRYVPKPQGL